MCKHFRVRNSSIKWAFQAKFVFAFVFGANLLALSIGMSPNKGKVEEARAHIGEKNAEQQLQEGLRAQMKIVCLIVQSKTN